MDEIALVLLEGPTPGQRWVLSRGGRWVVGRASDADVSVPDASLSRRHFQLHHASDGVWVDDLRSTSGTYLDGQLVRGPQRLGPGGRVRAGGCAWELRRTPQEGIPGIRLLDTLGEGGGGVVYRGVVEASGRPVAVKQAHADMDAVGRRRFEREAQLVAALEHPRIARVHGVRDHRGGLWLVRELVPGESWARRLQRGAQPWREALQTGVAVAQALAAAHAQGVIHRDVKPGNVILGPEGPVLIDFDLAKRAGGTEHELTRLTETGEGLGTLVYMAPEQTDGAHHVGPSADVYGLGASVFHALTGAPPFARVHPEDFFEALSRGPGPLVGRVEGPEAVLYAVERAYASDPRERPADGASLARSWAAALDGGSG